MGFKVVEGSPKVGWFPASCYNGPTAVKFYIGQLVCWFGGGVYPLIAAAAAPEVTTFPFGVVIGFNTQAPNFYDSTYKAEYATSVITKAGLIAKYGQVVLTEGMMHKNELQLMLKVALIEPDCTVLEGPIYNGTAGTAVGVVTCNGVDTDGLTGMTHTASDATLVANNNMFYCRSGKNRGLYRMSYAASATTPTFYSPWPYSWVVSDTFAVTNIGIGRQYAEFGAAGVGMFISNSDDLAEAYVLNVHSMNLEVAGAETAQFTFASYSAI